VIDVGTLAVPALRLVVSNGTKAQYACLSHCWGDYRPDCITTEATLERNMKEIPWPTLSKTFQDAVTVTRALGIRYLWIDSICIIQGKSAVAKRDWQTELGLMASVYGDAMLTLAAIHAGNGRGGLFNNNLSGVRELNSASLIAFRGLDGRSYTVLARKSVRHHWHESAIEHFGEEWKIPANASPEAPLLTRGWVYQERFLSPRIIHFDRREIAWECRQCSACQCFLSGEADMDDSGVFEAGHSQHQLSAKVQREFDLRDSPSLLEFAAIWRLDVVREFTQLKLTQPTDKLPAVSGIAKAMMPLRPHDSYMAGLWHKSMFIDLL